MAICYRCIQALINEVFRYSRQKNRDLPLSALAPGLLSRPESQCQVSGRDFGRDLVFSSVLLLGQGPEPPLFAALGWREGMNAS